MTCLSGFRLLIRGNSVKLQMSLAGKYTAMCTLKIGRQRGFSLSFTSTIMYAHIHTPPKTSLYRPGESHHWESITNNLTFQCPLWLVSTIASRLFQHTGVTSDLELSALLLSPCSWGRFQAVGSGPDFWNSSNWALWERGAGSFHLPWQINGRSHHRAGGQGLAQPANRIPMSLLTQHHQGC